MRKIWVWIILVLVLIALIYFGLKLFKKDSSNPSQNPSDSTSEQTSPTNKSWQERGVAIAGKYADAEVVNVGNGQYRMYYSVEPEVQGNNLEVYSATSADGIDWTLEEGTRKTMATFPDVIRLPNYPGAETGYFYRMYYQNAGVIKSATSTDGLTWTDEPGTRMDNNEAGFSLDNVGAQSTTILNDGTFIMAYRGTIPEPYQTTQKVPNQNTQLYFYATSKDGLTFEKKGIALDSRNETLYGLTDGGEWIDFDGELRMSFWSYSGVYHSVYKDGVFATPVFDYTNSKDSKVKFAPNPPGDPTLAKINGTWFMYYGQHTKGIYYAEYK